MSKVTEFHIGVAQQVSPTLPLWLRVGFWACIVIAVAAVIRRVFALVYPPHSAPPRFAAEEAMADSCDSNPVGYRRDASCHGSVLCDQPSDTSSAAAVFRRSFLDWLFNEHFAWRGVAPALQVLEI